MQDKVACPLFSFSTVALSNDVGAVTTTYTYGPFGSTTVTGTSTNPFQFTGRENDSNGLYYYRARYYSPSQSRFLSEDPLEFYAGDVNLYGYVFNNPTNRSDPSGENACVIGGLTGSLGFNAFVIGQSLAGRKASYYAGLQGLVRILIGNAKAFAAGCAVGAAAKGQEFPPRAKQFRIAPFGNRKGNHPTGRYPHYHRGEPDPSRPGHSLPGQSPKRHRPWDTSPKDKSFWDRF